MQVESLFPEEPVIAATIVCDDLDRSLAELVEDGGCRLFSIFPADSPRWAIVDRGGAFVKLEKRGEVEKRVRPEPSGGVVITRMGDSDWREGRAGMQYRDMIPGRLGGRLIASHIRIPEGGPVPDYVHFHKVAFQVICCIRGWCELVYEDQGPPFIFREGECVLQPPGIRHRVLRCSDGFEVIELSSPAEHPTFAEHGFDLPTETLNRGRVFAGQTFLHSIARVPETETRDGEIKVTRTGIAESSGGAIDVEWVELGAAHNLPETGIWFAFVNNGSAVVENHSGKISLADGDSIVCEASPANISSDDPVTSLLIFHIR